VQSNLAWFAAGVSIHNTLGVGFELLRDGLDPVERGGDSDADTDADEENQQRVNGLRIRKVAAFLRNPCNRVRILLTVIITVPTDALLQFIASTESSAGDKHGPTVPVLLQLCDAGILDHVQRELATAAQPGSDLLLVLSALAAVAVAVDAAQFWDHWSCIALELLLQVSAGLFTRLSVPRQQYPLKIFDVLRLEGSAQRTFAETLFTGPACCQDELFSKRLLGACGDASGLLSDRTLAMLNAAVAEIDVHTAKVERSHAWHKALASRATKSAESGEQLCYDSILQRFAQEYQRRGGCDPSTLSRDALFQSGVRTVGGARQAARLPSTGKRAGVGGNATFAYIAAHAREGRARRELVAEFNSLPPEAQREWRDIDQAARAARKLKHQTPRVQLEHRRRSDESRSHGVWGVGDDQWPLSAKRLAAKLRCGGMRGAADRSRPHSRKWMLIAQPADVDADIEGQSCTCGEKHPGVCESDPVHTSVATAARALSRHVVGSLDANQRFMKLEVQRTGEAVTEVFFYTALVRKQPPLVVCADVCRCPAPSEEFTGGLGFLEVAIADGKFSLQTSYSLLKHVFKGGAVDVVSVKTLEVWPPGLLAHNWAGSWMQVDCSMCLPRVCDV